MGLPWCHGLPVVTVPQSATPKCVTFIYPYYDNAQFLRQQVAWWHTYPADLKAHVSAIVVDDGSPEHPAADILTSADLPFPVRAFRIEVDIRWNWLAARNIGAHHAEDGWLVLTDMDHVVPASTLASVVYGQHDARTVYAFSRIEHTGQPVNPHSASFLMTRQMFWKIGGYDERMSGYYGSDGYYRRRMATVAPIKVLTDRLVRHEYQGDSSTSRYLRKQPEDARLRPLVASFPKGSKPRTLSFPYHEVPLAVAA